MNTIKNKARKPLRVPLPLGKTLHLGLGQTARVGDDALEHPPFKKLVDDGSIEVLGHSSGHEALRSDATARHLDTHGHTPGSAAAAPRRGNRGG